MVRNYIKKTDRQITNPASLENAAKLVKSGWSLRKAATHEKINRSVLWTFMKKLKLKNMDVDNAPASSFKLSHASRSIFSSHQEEEIKNYCVQVAKMGYGLTAEKVRQLAWEVASKNDVTVPDKWHTNRIAGLDWFHGFMKRYGKEISIRTPEGCSIARAMAFNRPTVSKYYENLEQVLTRHPSFQDGSRVYNIDETSTSTVQNAKKLVSPKGVKQVHQIKSAERGVSVTTSVIINAHGSILPPVMIFPRKVFKSSMLINCFPGTLGLANKNGYNTKETFVDVMQHFIKCTNSSKENPSLLLMDNVETHFSTECLDLAAESGVTVFTFPPHCTHKLQPLDIGFFGPFKTYYDDAIHSFILNNPAKPISIYHIAGFVKQALSKAGTPGTIISSFEKPGIIPFNRNVWEDHDFIMAEVTRHEADEADDNDSPDEPPSPAPAQEEETAAEINPFIGPEAIRGLPHATPTSTNKPKRKGRSMVATDTAEREAVRQHENEMKEKKLEAEKRKQEAEKKKQEKILAAAAKEREVKEKREEAERKKKAKEEEKAKKKEEAERRKLEREEERAQKKEEAERRKQEKAGKRKGEEEKNETAAKKTRK